MRKAGFTTRGSVTRIDDMIAVFRSFVFHRRRLAQLLCLLLTLPGVSLAQTIAGTIAGSVRDSSGLAVPGGAIKLVQPATGVERRTAANDLGDFVFSSVQPGEYEMDVSHPGFKSLQKRGIQLSANQWLALGDLVLQVGEVTERITVTEQAAVVQTQSAERAAVITSNKLDNLLAINRDPISLMQLSPGVVGLNVNGNRANANNFSIDGMTLTILGQGTGGAANVSMDAVSEVRLLLSNYQAEYGRVSGANIAVVTKSGTRNFHGLGSYFKRHEQFNANSFFSNRLGVSKPVYRYNTYTYNVGGPIYIPEKFNRNRDKLFFFWGQEFWPTKTPGALGQMTVPTELERAGDFSQSVDLNGKLIPVIDPTSKLAFPGNRIPAARIDPNGQALLKFFPMPNFLDRNVSGGNYNYVFQNPTENPSRLHTLKLDYNLNPANLLSLNMTLNKSTIFDGFSGSNWPQMGTRFVQTSKLLLLRHTGIVSPTLVNELNLGFNRRPARDYLVSEDVRRNNRDVVGFKTGQLAPQDNPLNLLPNAYFWGVPNAGYLAYDGRTPIISTHDIFTLTDNITKTFRTHTVKAGIYIDRYWRNSINAVDFSGTFDFTPSPNNPLNTGYDYSNAALGVYSSYTESLARPFQHFRVSNVEWFLQDNWKVTRRFTLDYGLRWAWIAPTFEKNNLVSGFDPALFNPARKVRLIRPAIVGGQSVGLDPQTGSTYNPTLVGNIVPGSGDPSNGMAVPAQDPSYPRSLIPNRGVHWSPRFGFAYDPFGKGRTAIRGGFGLSYDRETLGNMLSNYAPQTPVVQNPARFFGTLSTLLSTPGYLSPQAVRGIDGIGKVPSHMNISLGVQQNVGGAVVLDVGYVGHLGRHLYWTRNMNALPFGTNFNPANANPANPRTPLPAAFLYPYTGFTSILYLDSGSTSNYHSLQVTAKRRLARGVEFGFYWTWSKAMNFVDTAGGLYSTIVPVRDWNYGLAGFDRTHVVKIDWLWQLPKVRTSFAPVKLVLNDWQVSGITSFMTGFPKGVAAAASGGRDITGSPTEGYRTVVTGNPILPKSERTFDRFFRPDVFQLPALGTWGNAAKTSVRLPGLNNWDIAIFKSLPVHERVRVQFRAEFYNAFNHTQFSNVNTNARFNNAGQQINASLGQLTATASARIIQLAVRLYF